jgi:hypothetical protein
VAKENNVNVYLCEALVYDTQTGKSVYYERINNDAWKKQVTQLPASPLQ